MELGGLGLDTGFCWGFRLFAQRTSNDNSYGSVSPVGQFSVVSCQLRQELAGEDLPSHPCPPPQWASRLGTPFAVRLRHGWGRPVRLWRMEKRNSKSKDEIQGSLQ